MPFGALPPIAQNACAPGLRSVRVAVKAKPRYAVRKRRSLDRSKPVSTRRKGMVDTYDQLGRMTSKVHSGEGVGETTPAVSYLYDTHSPAVPGVTSYAVGRVTKVVHGGTTQTTESYDALGRVTRSRQTTGGVDYRFGTDTEPGYRYMRNGALERMLLPSGREVRYEYDDAGREKRVLSSGQEVVASVSYEAHGGYKEIRKNQGRLRETYSYSAGRQQLTGIQVDRCPDGTSGCAGVVGMLTLGYQYQTGAAVGNLNGPDNNGNVYEQRITIPGGFDVKQSYGYDGWNRLQRMQEAPVGGAVVLDEEYCYDAHGNRAVKDRAGLAAEVLRVSPCTAAAVSALFPNNRINLQSYDAAGGLAADTRSNLRYDAEDRVKQSWPVMPANAPVTTYGYDGGGKRVTVSTAGGTSTVYVYL